MKTVSISGSPRENVGKKDANILRQKGLVPCVVYGGSEQIHFSASDRDLMALFTTPEVCFVELNLNGKKIMSIPQEAQFHKVKDTLLHVDFFELRDDRPITMMVPFYTQGNASGVLKGGKLVKSMRKLRVRALPVDMPENITVDVTKMEILDEIKVKDLANEKYKILNDQSSAVVAVKTTRNAVAAEAAPAAEAEAAPAEEKK